LEQFANLGEYHISPSRFCAGLFRQSILGVVKFRHLCFLVIFPAPVGRNIPEKSTNQSGLMANDS
jgi:hypothetical protein